MASTGLAFHTSVVAATTGTLDSASGGTVSYNNGTSGVGAELTTTGTFHFIDGANVQTSGTRILVKNEGNAAWNGVYYWSNATTLIRTTDADTYGPDSATDLSQNDYFFVSSGDVNKGSSWVVTTQGVITFGTTAINFSQFSSSQTYSAGTGLTLTSTTFSVNNTQSQITSVGTLTALSVSGDANIGNIGTAGIITATGNITGANIVTGGVVTASGNITGANLTTAGTANVGTLAVTGTSNLNAIGNITITGGTSGQVIQTNGSGGLSFVTIDTWRIQNGTSNVAVATVDGNVTVAVAGVANIATFTNTGVVVAGTISSTGNATAANLVTGGVVTATGNVTGANLYTGGVVSATGNVTGANIVTGGVVTASGNVIGANIVTGGLVTATGNIAGGNLTTAGVVTATGNVSGGNVIATGVVQGATANFTTSVTQGTTVTTVGTVTTSSTTTNQTIASFPVTGITGVEYLVKGVDSAGAKYSVATVHAVTDGTNVDWAIYGGLFLTASTGSLSVNIDAGSINLAVTPASSNSTVWTTQYRLI